jgi:hypothetical protein
MLASVLESFSGLPEKNAYHRYQKRQLQDPVFFTALEPIFLR